MKCPNCRQRLIQGTISSGTIRFRIKEKTLRAENGSVRADCFWCGAEVVLPLQLMVSAESRSLTGTPVRP